MTSTALSTHVRESLSAVATRATTSYFSSIPKTPPPWYPLLNTHLQSLSRPISQLSTLSPPSLSPALPYASPRVRTMVYRGMFAELPQNKYNPLWGVLNSSARHVGSNEANKWTSDILTFTTDARSMKVQELFHAPDGYDGEILNKGKDKEGASGGGAQVEIMFWIGNQRQVQWRIRGRCYLLSINDIDKDEDEEIAKLKREISKYVWKTPAACEVNELCHGKEGDHDNGNGDVFSWSQEILAHFANLGPAMRGSFANPTPGLPLAINPEGLVLGIKIGNEEVPMSKEELFAISLNERDIHKRKVRVALGNFRVGVVIPEEVESLDLSARGGCGERWVYKRVREGEEDEVLQKGFGKVVQGWRVCEVWP